MAGCHPNTAQHPTTIRALHVHAMLHSSPTARHSKTHRAAQPQQGSVVPAVHWIDHVLAVQLSSLLGIPSTLWHQAKHTLFLAFSM